MTNRKLYTLDDIKELIKNDSGFSASEVSIYNGEYLSINHESPDSVKIVDNVTYIFQIDEI